ncbi:MAG: four helix bundle protein [Nitrospirae bacterium CG_4_9_14_3_um_filter_53_35]|nr:MAG: four helix bundle protein [Nitrospirae bacterium CG17_big_fil_post_rev_8_21_14_2_50_50_9]PIX86097.1 MAG: four helix bundle protein [Nitrospirae bacterium CG_4_10_14_3_um_filter_53_41]PJA77062.1 MAG: four helix bundle protein [Nitrospirae bacterium CG_4_9_14_3_um_filter_53_35]
MEERWCSLTSLKNYRDLQVWQKSIEWVEAIYNASKNFPQDERFGLTSQVRRAAVSVAANIAEGAERTSTGEFLQFLGIARGSPAEVETLLILAERLGLLRTEQRDTLLAQASEIGKMLVGLQRSLRSKH